MKLGDVVFVKTSEEPVTVIGTRKMQPEEVGKKFPESYHGSGDVVIVRRPVMLPDEGMQYKFFDFLAEELETSEQQANRMYANIINRQKLAMNDMPMESLSKLIKPS